MIVFIERFASYTDVQMMRCAFISSTKQTIQKLNTVSGFYILTEVALVTDAVEHRNLYGTSIIRRVIVVSAVQI